MTQLTLPVGDLPPALVTRISKIADACKAISRAAADSRAELHKLRRDFPDATNIVLSNLDRDADQLFLILRKVPTNLIASSPNEDLARRIDSQHNSPDQDLPQDRRQEANQ